MTEGECCRADAGSNETADERYSRGTQTRTPSFYGLLELFRLPTHLSLAAEAKYSPALGTYLIVTRFTTEADDHVFYFNQFVCKFDRSCPRC